MNEGRFADFYTLQGKMVWWFSLRCADRIQTRLQGNFPFKYEKGGKRLWQRLVTWPQKTKFRECTVEPGLMVTSLTKKPKNQIFSEFLAFWARFRQIFQIYHKRTHLLENWVTWLTHWFLELFAKISFLDILVLFKLEMRLQHNSLPFLPPVSRFTTLWLGHAQKSKFWKWPTSELGFSIFGIFFAFLFLLFFSFFAAVIDLLLGLLAVNKLLRKRHRDGQILASSSQM